MARFGDGDPLSGTRQGDGSYVQDVNVVGGGSSGGAVTIADGADVAEGATTAAAYTDQTGAASGTVVGLLKGVYAALRGTLATTGTVVGNVASRATDSGAPVKIGVLVSTATPADATAGQRIDAWGTSKGALVVAPGGLSFNLGDNLGLGNGAFTGIMDQGNNGKALVTTNLYYDGTNYSRQRGDTSGLFLGANQFWTESSTGLAASATLNGTLRVNGGTAAGVGSRFSFFVAEAFSDVAGGTLFIDKTVDGGTTYRQVGSIALVANTSVSLKVPLSAAGYRTRVVNGATPQGAALVTSAFSLN